MSDKFRNQYRIASHRRPSWDYSADGLYFITIVTQHRICNLGKIENSRIKLSDFGEIVHMEWLKSFEIRQELFCDEYIIMPNHLHAIIEIMQPVVDGKMHPTSIKILQHIKRDNPVRLPKSISSFMAGFKSAVNTKIDNYIDLHQLNIPKYNRNNNFFQSNYYDHIIRDEMEYQKIKNYIINNPSSWEDDTLNNP